MQDSPVLPKREPTQYLPLLPRHSSSVLENRQRRIRMTSKDDLVERLLLSTLPNEDDLASLVPDALDPRSEV